MDAPSFSSLNVSRIYADTDNLTVERLFFSNLLLLGFDVHNNELKYKIQFNHDMFKTPNVKGMEVVLHFLLSQLYPSRMSELLKFVWPVNDQIQAKQFKQIVATVLQELKDKLDLPPLISTLQSPSGKRFCELLWKLSYYALQSIMQKNYPHYEIPQFPLENASAQKAADISRAMKLHITRQARKLIAHAQKVTATQEQWRNFDQYMQGDYTSLQNELIAVNEEIEQLKAASATDLLSEEAEGKRKAQLESVRNSFTALNDIKALVGEYKESIDGILTGRAYPYQLNAKDLQIGKLPDDLLPLASGVAHNETQLSLDGLIRLYNAALLRVRNALPTKEEVAGVVQAMPQLAQWAKEHSQQLAAARGFHGSLLNQVIEWRRDLEEMAEEREAIDNQQLESRKDDFFKLAAVTPPKQYMVADNSMFASPPPRSATPLTEDILNKLANSVRRVALQNNRTYTSIADQLFSSPTRRKSSLNFPISTPSLSINMNALFDAVAQQPKTTTSTTTKRPRLDASQKTSSESSIFQPPTQVLNKTKHLTTTGARKSKPTNTTTISGIGDYLPQLSTPSTTYKPIDQRTMRGDDSRQSIYQPPQPKSTSSTTRPTRTTTTTTTAPTTTTTTTTTKPAPTRPTTIKTNAMDKLADEIATFMDVGENYEKPPTQPKSNIASQSREKPRKKSLPIWNNSIPDVPDLQAFSNTLDAMDENAFLTKKQIPRTPHKPETTTTTRQKAPSPQFTTDASPIFDEHEDMEWENFLNNKVQPPLPQTRTPTNHTPNTTNNNTTNTQHKKPSWLDYEDVGNGSMFSSPVNFAWNNRG